MKQVFLSGQGQIEVFDAPIPGRLNNGVLIENSFSLISAGTEGSAVTKHSGLHGLYEKAIGSKDRLDKVWKLAQTQGLKPTLAMVRSKLSDWTPIGYSSAGVIVETDSEDSHLRIGQRVACMGTGFANHAQYVAVPKHLVLPIPDDISLEEASFGALACIAIQGLRRLDLTPGERIAVIGLGLIGQLALRLAEAMGFFAIGIDVDDRRVAHSREHVGVPVLNAREGDVVAEIKRLTSSVGLDGVVICASSPDDAIVNQGFDLCRKRGRVSIVGDVGLNLERAKMYAKELELRLSCSYGSGRYDSSYELDGHDYPLPYVRWTEHRNLEHFINQLARRRVVVGDLISHKIPIDSAKDAYAIIKSGDSSNYGVLLDYGSAPTTKPQDRTWHYSVQEKPSATDAVEIGLIGMGGYARTVHLPNIAKIAALHVRGVASQGGASAAVVAKATKAAYATSDYRQILDDPRIGAVVIATRHASHGRIVQDALMCGKHVFVEKPLAITIADCLKIRELATKHSLVVRVGFNRRFAPSLLRMKTSIGSIGPRIFSARVNVGQISDHWSNSVAEGGRLLGEGVHFFDLASWILNSVPVAVSAQMVGVASAQNPNAIVNVRYEDGSLATINYESLGHVSLGKEYFELHGNGRSATLDDFQTLRVKGANVSLRRSERGDKGQFAAMEDFADAIRGHSKAGTSGASCDAGLWATAISIGAIQSAMTAKEVVLTSMLENPPAQ